MLDSNNKTLLSSSRIQMGDDSVDSQFVNVEERRPTVSVIIPTMNEAKNLPLVLPYLPMEWIDEVILVDGRSTDNTIEVAKQLLPSIRVVLETRKGKGIAMRAGYEESIGDILIVLDADGSNDPREIPRYITALLEGADFVKGSRFAPGGGTTDMPRYRKLGNGFFVLLTNLLFGVKFTDLCYGFHAFWRHCLEPIKLDSYSGFEIDTALYLQAVRSRLRIIDVPSFEGYRFYGSGKLQTIPDGFRVLKTIMRQWINSLFDKEPEMPMNFRGIKYAPPVVFNRNHLLQPRATLMQRLLEFMRLLGMMVLSGENTHRVMERTLMMTLDAVGADSGSLILLDENGNVSEVCFVNNKNIQGPDIASWSDILKRGVAGQVIESRQPILILDTSDDPRWLQREWDVAHRSAVSLPLSIGGMVVGALTLIRSESRQFTQDDLDTLNKLTTKN